MAEVAVQSVLDRLSNLLSEEVKLLRDVHGEVEYLRLELDFISSFLRDADAKVASELDDNNSNGLKTWLKHTREEAFRIEDVIDEYMLHVGNHRLHRGFKAFLAKIGYLVKGVKRRHQIASEIQEVKIRVQEIRERGQAYNIYALGGSVAGATKDNARSDPRMGRDFVEDNALVGIDSLREDLRRELVHGEPNRTVISVVGMGGVGKSTLARKVAKDQIAPGHFDCHAFINVSQSYKVEELLKAMIRLFYESRKEPYPSEVNNAMDGQELIGKCRGYLQDKRYFVVFDDVWKEDFWGDIEHALVCNDKSSRIMITTRNMKVAKFCKTSSLVRVHELKPLGLDLAQELLCKTAFIGKHCPPELKDLSFDIARKCEGLPLAIVAIGGVLSTKGRDVGEWQSLNDGLKSQLERNIHLTRISKRFFPLVITTCLTISNLVSCSSACSP